ncbi:MAG: glycosyltransferase family 39 protein [Bacteroidetes bacterium]|nr:glycosyltransferase family 39 protein [Bacteroidota bacterium]
MKPLPQAVRLALWAALLAVLAFRYYVALTEKQGLSHDESITYLCSAATEGRYNREIGEGVDRQLTAADIQAYYATPALNFGLVATDLATTDIHPPLYFWILHAVHHWFGFHVINGVVVNVIAGLLLILLLFHLVRRTSGSADLALVVVLFYSVSPAVAMVDLEARHYQLLGLIALASAWLSERISAKHASLWTWAAFTVVNLCGFLTHYYYVFLLVPGVILLWRRQGLGRPMVAYLASLAASGLLFLLVFPQVFQFIPHYLAQGQGKPDTSSGRLWLLVYFGGIGFFANGSHLREGIAVLIVAIAIAWGLANRKFRQHIPHLLTGTGTRSYFFWTLAWNSAFTAAFYYFLIAPRHAVGEQYFSYIWPLFAWFTVLALHTALPRKAGPWMVGALMIVMVSSLRPAMNEPDYMTNVIPGDWAVRLNTSDQLVTDADKRSYLPRLAQGLRPDLPIHLNTALVPSQRDMAATNVCVLVLDPDAAKLAAAKAIVQRPGLPPPDVLLHRHLALICPPGQ